MKRIMVTNGCLLLLVIFSMVAFSPSLLADNQQRFATTKAREPGKVYWHTDFDAGWREAKQKNLPMLIYITSDNCTYCNAMKRNTWCNNAVESHVARGFVAIELKPNRNTKALSRIEVKTYPTTLLGLPAGKVLGHRIGYQPPAEMQKFLSKASDKNTQSPVPAQVH